MSRPDHPTFDTSTLDTWHMTLKHLTPDYCRLTAAFCRLTTLFLLPTSRLTGSQFAVVPAQQKGQSRPRGWPSQLPSRLPNHLGREHHTEKRSPHGSGP